MIPQIVGTIGNVSVGAMQALTERLLTILLALFLIGGVGVFAVRVRLAVDQARLWRAARLARLR